MLPKNLCYLKNIIFKPSLVELNLFTATKVKNILYNIQMIY